MKRALPLAVATALAAARPASAAPPASSPARSPARSIDLEVPAPLWPPSLHMRPSLARKGNPEEPASPSTDAPTRDRAGTDPIQRPGRTRPTDPRPDDGASLEDEVIFRFNVGFGLDGGEPTDEATRLTGATLDDSRYARVRMYGFGDAVIGTRGLGVQSLSTYLAANYRFDHLAERPAQPVPSVRDGPGVGDLFIRNAHAEVDEHFDHPLLRPLSLRAGRQFRYGPAVAHFDGASVDYDTDVLDASVFAGYRVSLYGTGDHVPDEGIAGGDLRLDLFRLRRVPLVLRGSVLRFDGSTHSEGGLALQWNPDVLVGAEVRTRDRQVARQRLRLRARLSKVTVVSAELDNRTDDDWIYDLILGERQTDRADARSYLDLGPPLPRARLDVRAGTVLLRNIDLLLRGGLAAEHDDERDSAFSPDYIEAGGALEVRVRRAIAIGSSLLWRRYGRPDPPAIADEPGMPDALPVDTAGIGERSFLETGASVRYRQGARKFRAGAEFYMRVYRFATPYLPDRVDDRDVRAGGRFTVEGWASERLRLRAEYDLSSAIDLAPEITGLKSLRVLAEGRF